MVGEGFAPGRDAEYLDLAEAPTQQRLELVGCVLLYVEGVLAVREARVRGRDEGLASWREVIREGVEPGRGVFEVFDDLKAQGQIESRGEDGRVVEVTAQE